MPSEEWSHLVDDYSPVAYLIDMLDLVWYNCLPIQLV